MDRYLSLCTYLDGRFAQTFDSYGEFSAHLDEVLEIAHATPPPPEVFEWHEAVHAFLQGVKEVVDSQPADAPIDPFVLLSILPNAAAVQEAEQFLAPDLRERMAKAGCVSSPS